MHNPTPMKVSLLITENRQWDEGLMRQWFSNADAQQGLSFWNMEEKLEEGLILCWLIWNNINSSFHEKSSTKTTTVGVVIRDHSGTSLQSVGVRKRDIESVVQAELLAILEGLMVAKNFFQRIVLESDSLLTVNEILKGRNSCSEWRPIVQDVYDVMLLFDSCIVTHVGRACNLLAYAVAKSRCVVDDYTVWWESLPSNVDNLDVLNQ
ncbi:hypothetical protein PTKIN_Ptkin03bG0122100 [Pterospermum kingtungense]